MTKRDAAEVIAALRAVEEKATKGPWMAQTERSDVMIYVKQRGAGIDCVAYAQVSNCPAWRDDMRLIAAARNALPALLEVAEAANKRAMALRGVVLGGKPTLSSCALVDAELELTDALARLAALEVQGAD